MAALLAGSWRPKLPRPQKILWMSLTAGAFLATTLLTARAVFFLPLFFSLSFFDEGISDDSSEQRCHFPTFGIFLAAFGLGVLISWLRCPTTTGALYADILHPLLGSRWPANFLWLATVSLLITFFRPRQGLPLLRYAGLNSPGGVSLLLWANHLVITAIYFWVLSGMEIFAQYLLFSSGLLLAFAALLFAVASARVRAVFWVLLAMMSLLGSWSLIRPESGGFASANRGGLETVLNFVQEDDLLLVHSRGFDRGKFRVPFDLAGRGRIQTYENPATLKSLLGDPGIAASHGTVWILAGSESKRPWEKPFRSSEGNLIIAGESCSSLVLHQFRPQFFPHPVIIFSNRGQSNSTTETQGLHNDGVWTAKGLHLVFDFSGISAQYLDITLKGWRPEEAGPLVPDLVVQLNGKQLNIQLAEKSLLRFNVPPDLLVSSGNLLKINTPTFIPHNLDQTSSDGRTLGLDLHDIVLR